MRVRLKQLDSKIQDKEDAMAATRMTLIRQEDRIQKILLGLDRVKSSQGKLSDLIPSPEQVVKLMNDDPNLDSDYSRDFLLNLPDERDFHFDTRNDAESSEYSFTKPKIITTNGSATGSTLLSTADRPLVDVDDFNPWAD